MYTYCLRDLVEIRRMTVRGYRYKLAANVASMKYFFAMPGILTLACVLRHNKRSREISTGLQIFGTPILIRELLSLEESGADMRNRPLTGMANEPKMNA